MTAVDARPWAKVNLWRHASGELCVRPGLRQLYAPASSRVIVGGFSVLNSYTPEVWHYIFDVADSGVLDLRLRVLDETFQTVQVVLVNANVIPRVITSAVVEGQHLITSPDFPSLFGMVGIGGYRVAESVASTNPGTTAISVPRGICTVWCNRVVIADGRSMFISDPVAATGGDVRTFVAQNQNQRPGFIFGVHEGAGDSLIVVTSVGTYALSADAAAVGIVGSNGTGWRMVNHACATSFASSCVVRGRVYALTRDGYALVDVENDEEKRLSEPLMPRAVGARISLSDYRTARMYATDEGPLVSHDGLNAVHRTDVSAKISSWWTSEYDADDFRVRGTLRDLDGTELLVCENGVFAVDGDFDGDVALGSEETTATGLLFGVLPHDPTQSRLIRHIDACGAVGGASSVLGVSLRGSRKTTAMPVDGNGYKIGSGGAGKRLTTTPLTSARFDFGPARCERTDDVGIEIEVKGCLNRVGDRFAYDVADTGSTPGKVV